MSGPIVRKYGFPNFDSIFGKRELAHGVDETDAPAPEAEAPAAEPAEAKKPSDSAKSAPESKKKS
jgi:hypothetical protein